MRLLFCCEFFHPSVGGVQEVMRQVAERMVERGHQVTVATTRLAERDFDEWKGIRIESFAVSGNLAQGMTGEVERYRDFVVNFPADAILIKAAQQWTFDALFPVVGQIKARKIFIPCGFSGLFTPVFKSYFEQLPAVMAQYDGLVFYAHKYRDIDFCRAHGLKNLHFITNGASEKEFDSLEVAPDFRTRLGIPADSFLFSTVGSLTGMKGHEEVGRAFLRLQTGGRHATLVLNGNIISSGGAKAKDTTEADGADATLPKPAPGPLMRLLCRLLGLARRAVGLGLRAWRFARREGWKRAVRRAGGAVLRRLRRRVQAVVTGEPPEDNSLPGLVRRAEAMGDRQILLTNLARADVLNLFASSDLFVFASRVEYSPLVLFEAAAAGTPFLTLPVGNSAEIAEITGAGMLCPAERDEYGYMVVDIDELAGRMGQAMGDWALLHQLGETGRRNWSEHFTWAKIAEGYEAILDGRAVPEG